MAGEVQIKTFSGGMNKDLDFSLLKDNQYYDAQNMRLISDKEGNSFTLESLRRDGSFWTSTLGSSYYCVGSCWIDPYLILFYTTNHHDRTPSTAKTSKILRFRVEDDVIQESATIYTDGVDSTKLDFSDTYPIKAVGYYESSDNIKVYWSDDYNPVRWMNIMDGSLFSYTADMFDLTPDFPVNASKSVRAQYEDYISGNITCSTVQYVYQYYIPNGATTVWSPASLMISIPDHWDYSTPAAKGGNQFESSGYGVKGSLNIPTSNKFSYLRLAAIQYDSYNTPPTIRIFKELEVTPLTSYTLYFSDTGNTLNEITYSEYLVQTNTTFRAKDLTIKDNYLFAANIEEVAFDVDIDCRVYRHDNSGDARLYQENLTDYITVDDGAGGGEYDFVDVPSNHDCINRYNVSNYNSDDDEEDFSYTFQSDGTTWGAEGLNFKIDFVTDDDYRLDNVKDVDDRRYAQVYNRPYNERNFQRNEVYRIGIVFRNEKMQPSPVKWMCDLKMPSYHENSSAYAISILDTNWYRRLLGIKVTYTGDGTGDTTDWDDTGAKSWEVVMIPRGSEDRSILAQGIIQSTLYDDTDDYYWPSHEMTYEDSNYSGAAFSDSGGTVTEEEALMRFISPEVAFNKNLEFQDYDFLHYIGYFTSGASYHTEASGCHFDKCGVHNVSGTFASGSKKQIDDALFIGYCVDEDYTVTVDSKTYHPYVLPQYSADERGGCTSHMCISKTTDTCTGWWTGSADRVAMVNYKRDVFNTQYGGPSYEARLNNQYITISEPNIDNNLEGNAYVETYEGDTFIDWFYYYNTVLDHSKTDTTTEASIFLFPVETSIHLSYRLDDGYHRNLGNPNALLVQEESGSWEDVSVVDGVDRSWNQDSALYQYNPVYSQLNYSAFHIADTSQFEAISKYPNRIKYSEQKTYNETRDSFTEFKANNYRDLDGRFGPINNIDVFKGRFYFWQDSAFGRADVNERSLIQDSTGSYLALGTGGVLDYYEYISEDIGSQNLFGMAKGANSLYWVDNNKNSFYSFGEGLREVSTLEGIQSWLNDNGRIGDARVTYDHRYNEVLFTITFTRQLDAENVSGNYVDQFSMGDETGLSTLGNKYNCILKGRFDDDVVNSERQVIFYDYGDSNNWEIDGSDLPYGTTSSQYYVTVDGDDSLTYTISYNELAKAFVSFHSIKPWRYINLGDNLLSIGESRYHVRLHNYPTIAGTNFLNAEESVTVIFNKDYPYTKVWDCLKWDSNCIDDDGVNDFDDTFDEIQIWNEYQHTGVRELQYYSWGADPLIYYPYHPATRRERTWSTYIPRNIVDIDVSDNPDHMDSDNWDADQEFKERMRSKWLAVKLAYNTGEDKAKYITVPFISAVYRKSRR